MENAHDHNQHENSHHQQGPASSIQDLPEEGPTSAATDVPHRAPAPLELTAFDQPVAPQLALRSDGVVLLSTEELKQYDLSSRRRWTGIELTYDEFAEVRRRFAGVAEEAAAHVGGKLQKKKDRES